MTIRRTEPPERGGALSEPPTPRTPREIPDARPNELDEVTPRSPESPRLEPTAPLDVRVARLEAKSEAHDRILAALDRRVHGLHSATATVARELEICKGTCNSALLALHQLAKEFEVDRVMLMRELGVRARQDSIHDEQHAEAKVVHAEHRAEIVEVKKRLTWRQITSQAASKGVAGGLVFGAGVIWHEVYPLLVDLAKRALGR